MSHPCRERERLETPGIGELRFREYDNFDIPRRQAVFQQSRPTAEEEHPIKIRMHADMRLQLTLNIPDDVLDVRDTSLLDFPGNVMAFEAVLQIPLFDEERDFDRREGTRRREALDARQEKAGRHLMDPPLVEGLAMDDLLPLR